MGLEMKKSGSMTEKRRLTNSHDSNPRKPNSGGYQSKQPPSKHTSVASSSSRVLDGVTPHRQHYDCYLDQALVPVPTTWTAASDPQTPRASVQRSMWYVNLSILSCEKAEQAELNEFKEKPEVLFETQIVINYDRLDMDLKAKMIKTIEKVLPTYHSGFYVEGDYSKFERAVMKTREWMAKSRTLSNPLHYSPPPIPAVTVRLCDPVPLEDDLMSEDAQFERSC